MNTDRWSIELLTSHHKLDTFTCGQEALDLYIRKYASQDLKRHVALVFVACAPESKSIRGYYTLSAASFRKEGLPLEFAKRLPHYPVPAVIIGRLAVDQSFQGKGLGEYLLMDSFSRILEASKILAIHSIIVDAKDEGAVRFYRKYGFRPFVDLPKRLFLPMATLLKLK